MLGSFSTVGHAAGLFQKSPREIKTALDALGKRPVLSLNDLWHWQDADLEEAVKFLNDGGVPAREVPADAD